MASGDGPLTATQVEQFEELGYVLVDTPFDEAWLTAAEAAFDRLTGATPPPEISEEAVRWPPDKQDDEGYVEALSHPFLERVAQQMLRAERVRIIEEGPTLRPPGSPDDPPEHDAAGAWAGGAHIDWQCTDSDFRATPRRDLLACWLWLTDTPAERAAMRILPRSHRAINQHFEKVLKPEHKQWLPRHHPLFPRPPLSYPTHPEHIEEPADFPYSTMEPTPVVAKRGQLQVFTQTMLHTAWRETPLPPSPMSC